MTDNRKFKPALHRWLVAFMLLLLPGCTVGPQYREPDVSKYINDAWRSFGQSGGRFDDRRPMTDWWNQFDDPELSRLIAELFASNLALEEARQRIVEVNARQGVIEADKRLQLAAALGYTHAETGDEIVSLQALPPGKSVDVFTTGLVADWDLDLWGRTGRLLEAAEQDIRAGYADYQAMAVSLAAELTLAYVEIRTDEARLVNVRENLKLQQKSLALARTSLLAGNGTELAVIRAERLLQTTRARIPELERRRALAENRIGVLLGRPPQAQVLTTGPLPAVPPLIGIGLPIDLMSRRADLRQAVYRYHGAVARIGAAEAERYPTLRISGTMTLSSDSLKGMLDADALIYSLGPGLSFPVLNGGRIDSLVAVRGSQAEQARIALERILVGALAEVENGATGVVRSQQQTAELEQAAGLAAKSVKMSETLYGAGLGDLFQVLDNEQQQLAIQDALLLARQQALADVVYLYRALGGGWEELTIEPAADGSAENKGNL